jgi:hypothetical protein
MQVCVVCVALQVCICSILLYVHALYMLLGVQVRASTL